MEATVGGPEPARREGGGGEQVHVGPAEPATEEAVSFEKPQDFGVARSACGREASEKLEGGRALTERPAGDLPDYRGMSECQAIIQEPREHRQAATQMLDPDGGVGEHHGRFT